MKKILLFAAIILFVRPAIFVNAATSDYLILNDIGIFRPGKPVQFFKKRPPVGGPRVSQNNSGVVSGADHFQDHADTTYKLMYIDDSDVKPSPEVEVTQHAGVDSDKWLLHELDRNFRNYYGMPSNSYAMRIINGNTIMAVRTGGGEYQWLSGNKVIYISYTDLQLTKPEPLEVVQAYLSKFPSSLPNITSTDLRTSENKTKWIKDEMERRLWLCDKWSMQLQLGKVSQTDMLNALVENMTIFLNYRQKYLGQYVEKENTADKEITALSAYLTANDGTSIKAKLTEYKTWWSANKSKSISL